LTRSASKASSARRCERLPAAVERSSSTWRPDPAWIPQWWAEEGGRAITFGSDAHTPDWLAGNFYEAMAMAEHFGFHPGRRPQDFWTR
jgi:hypothetical protein